MERDMLNSPLGSPPPSSGQAGLPGGLQSCLIFPSKVICCETCQVCLSEGLPQLLGTLMTRDLGMFLALIQLVVPSFARKVDHKPPDIIFC